MKVIYVCGPYRSPDGSEWEVETNIRRAEQWALSLWQSGAVALCPHKNSSRFGGACEDEVWLFGGIELLKRSDGVAVIPHSERSLFTQVERLIAVELGIPVFDCGTSEGMAALTAFIQTDTGEEAGKDALTHETVMRLLREAERLVEDFRS